MIASPCTGICKLDEATGWCLGCGRDGGEIAEWGIQPAAWRDRVWNQIPERLSRLGIEGRRLPMTTEDIRNFVASTINDCRGTWVMGVVGAVAEFSAAPGEGMRLARAGDELLAFTRNGAMRMTLNDDVRALTFEPPSQQSALRIVLAVKRERGRLPAAHGITDLGVDKHALLQEAGTRLFDLGLGRKEARFCVRVAPGSAQQALDGAHNMPFADALSKVGGRLIVESPTRVVETALGRIEVQGQIPPPGARSPDGPHTHLLPDHLTTLRAMPVGMDLPRAYLSGAIFYPPSETPKRS